MGSRLARAECSSAFPACLARVSVEPTRTVSLVAVRNVACAPNSRPYVREPSHQESGCRYCNTDEIPAR